MVLNKKSQFLIQGAENDMKAKLSLNEVQDKLFDVMCYIDDFCTEHQIKYYMLGGTALGAKRHQGFIPWDDDIDIGMLREDYEKFISLSYKLKGEFVFKNYRSDRKCDSVITRLYYLNTEIQNPAIDHPWFDKRMYLDVFPLDYVPCNIEKQEKQKASLQKLKSLIWWSMPFRHTSNIVKRLVAAVIHTCLRPFHNVFLKRMDRIMATYSRTEACGICSMASQYTYEKQNMPMDVYGDPAKYKFRDKEFYGPEKIDVYLERLFGPDYMQVPPEAKRRRGFSIYENRNQ